MSTGTNNTAERRSEILTADIAGCGTLRTEHIWERKDGGTTLQWTGPKLTAEVIRPVQAFLRKVCERDNSEAQVRLYCNQRLNKWAAWAYPQRARTGMGAEELDTPEADVQRGQFRDSEGWEYMGTIHSHCNGAAWQSSVDLDNEKRQDGIHITFGKVKEAVFDVHGRFCWRATKLNMDLKLWQNYWQLPDSILNIGLDDDLLATIAKKDICRAPAADQTYPQQWIDNVIEAPRVVVKQQEKKESSFRQSYTYGGTTHTIGSIGQVGAGYIPDKNKNLEDRCTYEHTQSYCVTMLEELIEAAVREGFKEDDIRETLDVMDGSDIAKAVIGFCRQHRCTITDLVNGMYEFDKNEEDAKTNTSVKDPDRSKFPDWTGDDWHGYTGAT